MALQGGFKHRFLGEPSLGVKGQLGVHAHLITGPIWRVPTASQTSVFKEVDFRRQIYFSYRSLQQLSYANYSSLLVAVAKFKCCSRGERLCILLSHLKISSSSIRFQENREVKMNVSPEYLIAFLFTMP